MTRYASHTTLDLFIICMYYYVVFVVTWWMRFYCFHLLGTQPNCYCDCYPVEGRIDWQLFHSNAPISNSSLYHDWGNIHVWDFWNIVTWYVMLVCTIQQHVGVRQGWCTVRGSYQSIQGRKFWTRNTPTDQRLEQDIIGRYQVHSAGIRICQLILTPNLILIFTNSWWYSRFIVSKEIESLRGGFALGPKTNLDHFYSKQMLTKKNLDRF